MVKVITLFAVGLFAAHGAHALTLPQAFEQAKTVDLGYRQSVFSQSAAQLDLEIARAAYYPTGSINIGRPAGSDSTEKSISIRQPIIDLGAWTRLKRADPTEASMRAGIRQGEQDLAKRVLATILDLVRLKETLRFNESQLEALVRLDERARALFERGQGTILEVRNTAVRLQQARGQRQLLKAQLAVSERQFQAVIGALPQQSSFRARSVPARVVLIPLEESLSAAAARDPQVLQAEAQLKLAELTQQERTADFIPNVSFVAEQRWRDGQSSALFTGVSVSIPYGVSVANILGRRKAGIDVLKAQERVTEARLKVRNEIEALHAFLSSGLDELEIRRSAIAAAELSATATLESFEAGLGTSLDVTNSLLTVFEVKQEYLQAVLNAGKQLLDLQLASVIPPEVALEQLQQFLFDPKSGELR